MDRKLLSHLFTQSNRDNVAQGLQNLFQDGRAADDKSWCFSKKMSHSVWQSSLIMSVPADRTFMKAVNGKYVVWFGRQHISRGGACGSIENVGQGEKNN